MRWALALAAVAAVSLVGCDQLLEVQTAGAWQLEAGSLDGRPVPIVAENRITMTVDANGVSGTAACNHYGGRLESSGPSFKVIEVSSTAMGCEAPIAASEAAFLQALGRVASATRAGDRLLLSGPGVELRFVALQPVNAAALVDTRWILETLTNADIAQSPQGAEATLELRSDGSLRGSTGCRQLTGRYVVQGDEVRITELAADGECNPELQAQDSHVADVIGDGFQATVDGDRLTLVQDGSLGLIYRQAR